MTTPKKSKFSAVRLLLSVLFYLSVPIAVTCSLAFYLRDIFLIPVDATSSTTVLVEVPASSSFKTLSRGLEQKGLIKKWWSVNYLARFRGDDRKLVAGEYELTASMSALQILNKLAEGDVLKRRVTIPEGTRVEDFANLFESASLITKDEFKEGLADLKPLRESGIQASSYEGYLFPNTYFFSRPLSPRVAIYAMLAESNRHWTPDFESRSKELNMTRHEIITLASIIEKESGNSTEQPKISSVFHNRLKNRFKLQSDPTTIYGELISERGFDGNLTREHLNNPTEYNTYQRLGLPPGPICNPGQTAISAALYPEDTPFLYFVGNGKGSHVFSSTLNEHNQAVNKYQRGL